MYTEKRVKGEKKKAKSLRRSLSKKTKKKSFSCYIFKKIKCSLSTRVLIQRNDVKIY